MPNLDEYCSSGYWMLLHVNSNILLMGATFARFNKDRSNSINNKWRKIISIFSDKQLNIILN